MPRWRLPEGKMWICPKCLAEWRIGRADGEKHWVLVKPNMPGLPVRYDDLLRMVVERDAKGYRPDWDDVEDIL